MITQYNNSIVLVGILQKVYETQHFLQAKTAGVTGMQSEWWA